MKISLGLGWLFAPLRYRKYRRLSTALLFVMGAFSFVTFDLVPRDGHLIFIATTEFGAELPVVEFRNTSTNAVRDLDASFGTYRLDGTQIASDTFAPRGMTVEVGGEKGAILPTDIFPQAGTAFVYFCGVFRGSYLIDKVREEWVVTRLHTTPDRFGQSHYRKRRHFITTPDCTPPSDIAEHAQKHGWDIERVVSKLTSVGLGPATK